MDLDRETSIDYDVIIIGAGIGGLLAAAYLSKMGHRVVVLERLKIVGGRFTSIARHGFQLSSGAVHMVPFGPGGVLAGLLRLTAPRCHISGSSPVSFYVGGQHVVWRKPWDVLKLFSPREQVQFLAIMLKMRWPGSLPQAEPFGQWLKGRTSSQRVFRLFERIVHFSLSVEPDDLSCYEAGLFFQNARRMGNPGMLVGGCGMVARELAQAIERQGGVILTRARVAEILLREGAVWGVRAWDARRGRELLLRSNVVISDVGPQQTCELLAWNVPDASIRAQVRGLEPACGLKVHFSSDESLLPHSGIMFCLDTQRIAGIVQPSNADPGLAPQGKHLLISHQVLKSGQREERDMALGDLEHVFQDRFQVLSITTFQGRWPVNRARQGSDVTHLPIKGLHMVGDGCKPPGYPMVEGVARSVENVVNALVESPSLFTEQSS